MSDTRAALVEKWRKEAADARRAASDAAAMHSMNTYTRAMAKAGTYQKCADELSALLATEGGAPGEG